MENLSPSVFWVMLGGAVSSTAWLVGRLSGKVDWKAYEKNRSEFQGHITDLKTSVSTLLERSENQGKLIEHFVNGKTQKSEG